MRTRRGSTLIELLVSMTLLGILAGVTTLAVRRFDQPRPDDPHTLVADALRVAADSARDTILYIVVNDRAAAATIRPDGTVNADSAFTVDRFTGRPLDAR